MRRAFDLSDGDVATFINVEISGLTLTGGDRSNSGGAIRSEENLTVRACVLTANWSGRDGGAIHSGLDADLTILDSAIYGNAAARDGGGVYSHSAHLTISNSAITDNSADGNGGGVYVWTFTGYVASIEHSTIAFNRCDAETPSGGPNSGGSGGIFVRTVTPGLVTLSNSLVAGNLRQQGVIRDDIEGPVTMAYSLIGDKTNAVITDHGGNLGILVSPINPLLGALSDHGGPGLTHALLTGSPAIDAGDPAAVAGVGGVPLYDERGAPYGRVLNGRFGRQSLTKHAVDPDKMVRRCLEEMAKEQQGRQVEIVIGELPSCQADPTLLKQVWTNLLSNALKYTRKKESARIEIGSRTEPRVLAGGAPASPGASLETVYFVKDNGAGFDMKYVRKLFGVFQRLHKAADYEGTGVGLAIVQRIVQRHGGRIWAEAALNQGASFYFTLN